MSKETLLELLRHSEHRGIVDEHGVRTSWTTILARAWQGAHLLREAGVSPGDRVAICLPPGREAIIFALASLAAGAVYVPLDALSPGRRCAMIVADAGAKILVTRNARSAQALLAELETASRPAMVITLDENEQKAGREPVPTPVGVTIRTLSDFDNFPCTRPSLALEPDALAYILFTSGSTGRPKGVAISHRAARAFVDWSLEVTALTSEDCVGAFTPMHFDLSVFDVYASIAAGTDLVIVPRRLVSFASELVDFLARRRVSVIYTVPSVLVQLTLRGNLEQAQLPRLRTVMFAGEVFPIKHLRQFMLALPGRRYLNLYGPTETNVCCYHELEAVPDETSLPTPIGRACAGAVVFALNEAGKAITAGEVGELYVCGPVLMHGYWGQGAHAGLSPDPREASPNKPELVYPTGDLVSIDKDGIYTWVGRSCQTIKSAGYRIEPGEVEHRLLEHPDVAEAYLLARPHPTLGTQLEAVVVCTNGQSPDSQALQAHCARALPRWMIPTQIRFADSVPRTSTGKIDRQRLLTEGEAPCSTD